MRVNWMRSDCDRRASRGSARAGRLGRRRRWPTPWAGAADRRRRCRPPCRCGRTGTPCRLHSSTRSASAECPPRRISNWHTHTHKMKNEPPTTLVGRIFFIEFHLVRERNRSDRFIFQIESSNLGPSAATGRNLMYRCVHWNSEKENQRKIVDF